MKKNFKYAALFAAALTLGLTGCSNDENAVNGGVVEAGKPTEMTLELDMPNMQTKAADGNASTAESTVKSVDVFIYVADDLNPENAVFESHTRIEDNFVVGTNGKFSTGKAIATQTGKKHIYVGVNLPLNASGIASGLTTAGALATKILEMTRDDMTTLINGLPMFSKNVYPHEMNEDRANNKITVTVKRMVSKITVEKSSALTGTDHTVTGGKVSLDPANMRFAVYNFNLKQYLVQADAPEYKDPNWASFTAGDFCVNPTLKDWQSINTSGVAAKNANAVYASENTSENKTKGEITRVTLRTIFTPTGFTTGQTFWARMKKDGNNKPTTHIYTGYFATESDATTGLPADEAVVKYTNGYCYYHIYLNRKDLAAYQFDVPRNKYIKCTINSISAPGRYTPQIEEPESGTKPTDPTPSYELDTDVDISAWEVVPADEYDL